MEKVGRGGAEGEARPLVDAESGAALGVHGGGRDRTRLSENAAQLSTPTYGPSSATDRIASPIFIF
jgi:hypothetical protein